MILSDLRLQMRQNIKFCLFALVIAGLTWAFSGEFIPEAKARSMVTPWTADEGFRNLVYGGSSTTDVQNAMGSPPDEIVKSEQMYPIIENYYYFDDSGSGAATVFVFENGLLVGMQFKSPSNQFIDLTYFLMNNGDRYFNLPALGGYQGYYPNFPFYQPNW